MTQDNDELYRRAAMQTGREFNFWCTARLVGVHTVPLPIYKQDLGSGVKKKGAEITGGSKSALVYSRSGSS
jgi:hypothetical protein